jgi:predicted neutral ceramidase superfamily lipid hydrolase
MTETAGAEAESGSEEGDGYGGVFGAYPYAFRRSESRLFKSYVVLGGLLALLLAFFFVLTLVVQVANTLGGPGGTFTFSRALFILVGFLVVAPMLAPVLFVARHHRRVGSDPRYDRLLAGFGFLFLVSLYLGVTASIPPEFVLDGETVTRPDPSGLTAPLVAVLYAVPETAAPLIPFTAALLLYFAHRYAQ